MCNLLLTLQKYLNKLLNVQISSNILSSIQTITNNTIQAIQLTKEKTDTTKAVLLHN